MDAKRQGMYIARQLSFHGVTFRVKFYFFNRGVGAMELVAMDAKLRGMYIARQLSFHGVTFRIEEIPLEKDFIKVYNLAVEMVGVHLVLSTVFGFQIRG